MVNRFTFIDEASGVTDEMFEALSSRLVDGVPLFSGVHKLNLSDPEVYRRAMALYEAMYGEGIDVEFGVDLLRPIGKRCVLNVVAGSTVIRTYGTDEFRTLKVKSIS